MDALPEFGILGNLVIAAFLGGLVGLEREFAEKPAGLRTHMLVAATAAFFVMIAHYLVTSFGTADYVRSDPIRVVEAIVVGISFLGAGTILKHERQDTVEGLTTSASILSVAAIGLAVGLGLYILAAGAALLNLFINWGIVFIAERINPKRRKE